MLMRWSVLLIGLAVVACNDGRNGSSAGADALSGDVGSDIDAAPDALEEVAEEPVNVRSCDTLLTCGFYGQCQDRDGSFECDCHEGFTHESPWCVAAEEAECDGEHGWTVPVPAPDLVSRHQARVFALQPGSNYGAAVAYVPTTEDFGDPEPQRVEVWFPAEDGEHAFEPLTSSFRSTNPDLIAMTPLERTGAGQRWAAVGNGSHGVCSDVRLHMGVIEPTPSTWPMLDISFLELLDEFEPGAWPRDNGDAPADCRALSVTLLPGLEDTLHVFTSFDVRAGESMIVEVEVNLGDYSPVNARVLGYFSDDNGGEIEGITSLRASRLSSGVFVSGVLAAQFAAWIVVGQADLPGEPDWTRVGLGASPRGSTIQEPRVFEHTYPGESRRHVFSRDNEATIALQRWTDSHEWVDSGHIPGLGAPHLSRVGGSLFWIGATPDGGAFDFVSFSPGTSLEVPGAFQRARIELPSGDLENRAFSRVHSIEDRIGNLEAFQVVFDSEGTASAYYEQVQQGAAERMIIGGEFIFGLAEGCP